MVPDQIKIYHIVHVDRLASIIDEGRMLSDAKMQVSNLGGSTIGMASIKARRLKELQLGSHPGLYVGQCVPFYFCARSIMLFLIYMANHPELTYRGGQSPILHLEADFNETIEWAKHSKKRWAFTLSNAGSYFFEDRADTKDLGEVDWAAVNANQWTACKEGKQAEFLIEDEFPWELVGRIGVYSKVQFQQVKDLLQGCNHKPNVEIKPNWYY